MNDQQLSDALATLMAKRYSCRNYSDRPVGRDQLLDLVEAARVAPSACNRQPWHFVIVTDPGQVKAVAQSYERDWINTASAFIVCCGDHDSAWHRADGKDHTDVDISIATEHICLAATAAGLATCWVCNFDLPQLRKAINAPDHIEPIVILPVGYPAEPEQIPAKKRKSIEEITIWEKF